MVAVGVNMASSNIRPSWVSWPSWPSLLSGKVAKMVNLPNLPNVVKVGQWNNLKSENC
jgi:hypothetical protein